MRTDACCPRAPRPHPWRHAVVSFQTNMHAFTLMMFGGWRAPISTGKDVYAGSDRDEESSNCSTSITSLSPIQSASRLEVLHPTDEEVATALEIDMLHQTVKSVTRRPTTNSSSGIIAKAENGYLTVDSSPSKGKQTKENGSATSTPTKENGCNLGCGSKTTPTWVYVMVSAIAVVTVVTCPIPFHPHGHPTLKHVFFYGWLTALSTGLGVLPLACLTKVAKYWVGVSNGTLCKAGLGSFTAVLSFSFSLVTPAIVFDTQQP